MNENSYFGPVAVQKLSIVRASDAVAYRREHPNPGRDTIGREDTEKALTMELSGL